MIYFEECPTKCNILDTEGHLVLSVASEKVGLYFRVRCSTTPWWLSWLDRGALINVDSPGCGTSVVQGPKGK